MENHSYSSYNSGDSSTSPRSSDNNCSWDDNNPPNYKVKFMVSYNGKIQPRPHDNNRLSYIGGDTKILTVDRHIKFGSLLSKLSSLAGPSRGVCFKYQLPGENLDSLVSVTNDEDLEHMMLEYDRMRRSARLRLFLFQLGTKLSGDVCKVDGQCFVEAVNPDYLFGFDKVGVTGGSDCGSETVASPTEIQRQINELQRLQISGQLVRKVVEEGNRNSGKGFAGEEHYGQSLPEKVVSSAPLPAHARVAVPHSGYVPERNGNFQVAVGGGEQPVYLVPAGAAHGVYQPPPPGMWPVAGHPGQGYYGMQRVLQEVHPEQQGSIQQQGQKVMAAGHGEGMGFRMMQQKVEQRYVQVGYDAAGRQVYYTVPAGVPPPVYQTSGLLMAAVEGKAVGSGDAVNQEGKV